MHLYIGGRAGGKPEGWPCFAEIKRLSLGLGKSLASYSRCPCARWGSGRGLKAGGGTCEAGGGVHTDPAPPQNVFCSAAALIGWGSGVPANPVGGSCFTWAGTLEAQKRGAPRTEPQAQATQ